MQPVTSVITTRSLAAMLSVFVLNLRKIGIKHDALRPDSARNRLPRARPITVMPTCRARSTPHAVKPDRDTRIGIRMAAHLRIISEVSLPVV
jgi:hypothetical protein